MTTLVLPHAPSAAGPAARALACELRTGGVAAGVLTRAVQAVTGLLAEALRSGRPLPGGALRVSWSIGADGDVRLSVRDGAGLRTADVRAPEGALVPH